LIMNASIREVLRGRGVDLDTEKLLGANRCFEIAGGDAAVALWQQLQIELPKLGAFPILFGESNQISYLEEAFDDGDSSQDARAILAEVPDGDPTEMLREERRRAKAAQLNWLKEHASEFPESLQRLGGMIDAHRDADSEEIPDYSRWTLKKCAFRPVAAFGLGTNAPRRVRLAVIPTAVASDAPAHLRFGGFNECPSSALHVAMMRAWNCQYGAVPVAITHDTIEMFVERPPQRQEDAWELAKVQYEYCSDIVTQGTQTLEALAQEIWKSPQWFFWWD
jgi:hypothetical protein